MRARSNVPVNPDGDTAGAYALAVALLARRDRASQEMREKLEAKGYGPAAVAEVIAELGRTGLLNDERYAQNYVAHHAGRGQGPVRIAVELRRRGLDAESIDAALANGPDWSALARKVCRAKFGPEAPAGWPQRARQARFLQYRGFSSDHIRSATGADPDTGSMDS
ncbi:MAG: regulatory protein RecX [Gammaproteobacteria bacterium]|nr:regulatory protein RecX [Gammaproteobacteria bacterium]